MTPCAQCSVDDEGYCATCGFRAATGPPTEVTGTTAAVTTVLRSPQRTVEPEPEPSRIGARESVLPHSELLRLPSVEEIAPANRVLTDAVVPEAHRVCGGCHEPVGRSMFGQPALAAGFCSNCTTRFSFEPKLRRTDRLGHYEIVDPLAHGGVGWVYLARDTHLDNRYVAIKGLINENDPTTVEAAVNEKKFLITFDHENVLRILDFVVEPDEPDAKNSTGYIVMEYIDGKSLHEIKQLARAKLRPLPVVDVVRYGLQILSALDYVHGRGYVYCDLKPDNVIHQRQRIKLIDLGAVCPVDFRGDVWVTDSYSVSNEERQDRGMQVDMDLYSLGRTLNELLTVTVEGAPPASPGPLSPGIDSLRLALDRATKDWPRRFPTAADMREQLEGVLRQLTGLGGATLTPMPSARFTAPAELLDDGLGQPPALDTWTDAPAGAAVLRARALADGRPAPPLVALRLPGTAPDRADPAAAFLAGMTTTDPDRLLTELGNHRPSPEIELARCRAHLALRQYEEAGQCLDRAEQAAGRADDWRVLWHRALLATHQQRITDAGELFTKVHKILPGELAPRLALGYCAEQRGELARAAEHYRAVWRTDRAAASAAFGLARTLLAEGDRDGAVDILGEVPPVSRHYDAARTAAVRVRVGRLGADPDDGRPRTADVVDAVHRLEPARAGVTWVRLVTIVRQAALELLRANGDPDGLPPGVVLGSPVTEHELRLRLERSFRELAGQAEDDDQYGTLLDLAYAVRPRTRW